MIDFKIFLPVCLSLTLMIASSGDSSAFKVIHANAPKFVPGEMIVKFKNEISARSRGSILQSSGYLRAKTLDRAGGIHQVTLRGGESVDVAVEAMRRNPDVEFAQPNFIYHALTVPNDPSFGQLWGLRNTGQTIVQSNGPEGPTSEGNPGTANKDMGMEKAWSVTTDCSSVVVAVVDSGVKHSHEDLSANMWDGGVSFPHHGYDYIDNDNNPDDLNGHGTHVAATIGAVGNNSIGTTGVCWNAKIMALRVLDSTGIGSTSAIIQGINFAVSHGAKVINLSLGGGSFDSAMSSSISAAKSSGVLFVTASGNSGENVDGGSGMMYPCAYTQDNVLCVAALNQDYTLASYSNYGSTSVDVGAPGTNVLSAWHGSLSTVASDSLTSGWNKTSTTSTGWGYKSLNFGSPVNCLVNPSNYNYYSAKYANSTDDRIWKSFNLSDVGNGLFLSFDLMHDLENNADFFTVHVKNANTDPIVNGTVLDSFTGSTGGFNYESSYEITDLASSATSIGFRLTSNGSVNSFGANVGNFKVRKLALNDTTYNVVSGTSMATPHVAGLATMLFSYNPNYTYAEVIDAIKSGGIATTALSGKSVTGKAVNAQGSLSYIAKPTGVSATVAP